MMITLILQTPTHGVEHNKNVEEWKYSNHKKDTYLHIEQGKKIVMNGSDGILRN